MEQSHINNSRSRMVEHPYLLNMFDLGLETINRLGISVDVLKRYKNNNHWRIYADILKVYHQDRLIISGPFICS